VLLLLLLPCPEQARLSSRGNHAAQRAVVGRQLLCL
jgi:hypothetical protein